jgi:hypothetical protein
MSLTLSAQPKTGEAILSGMIISTDENGQWVKGCTQGRTPYVAFHDQTDTDVVSCGLLLGLSCAGEYEIETAYFTDTTFNRDDALIASAGTPGNVAKAAGSGTETADLIGFVSKAKRQVQAGRTTGVTGNNNTVAYDPTKNVNSQFTVGGTAAANSTLTFVTRWLPKTLAHSAA